MNRTLAAGWISIFFVLGVGPAHAADEPASTDDRPYWRENLLKRFLSDQQFLVRTWWPAEARRYDFSIPLVLAIAGASGSSNGGIDRSWQRSIEAWTTGGRRDVAETATALGDSKTAALLLGGTYLASRWSGNVRLQRTVSLSSEALLNTALYAGLLKRLTRRTRPASAGVGEFFVVHPLGGQEASSFPSGHATGAFAVATVFAREFQDRRWVKWVAYGSASLIAASRVGLGRHFPSDVLAGAALGRSIGRMVSYRNHGEVGSSPWNRLEPIYEPRNRGFGIGYRVAW